MGGKYSEIERFVHRKVNTRRERHGLEKLRGHPALVDAAQSHARDMARRDFYSHDSPDGQGVSDRVPGKSVSENIAKEIDHGRHPNTIAENAVASWMQSEGHRYNILREKSTYSGVGVWKRREDVLIVQVFAASVPDRKTDTEHSLFSDLLPV